MFSPYITLDDASIFKAAELDEIALLADTWDNDIDPEVSAQQEQANVRAYLPFGKEKEQRLGQVSCSLIMFARAKKLNVMPAIEKDMGHMITNAQCSPSVCFRNLRHALFV